MLFNKSILTAAIFTASTLTAEIGFSAVSDDLPEYPMVYYGDEERDLNLLAHEILEDNTFQSPIFNIARALGYANPEGSYDEKDWEMLLDETDHPWPRNINVYYARKLYKHFVLGGAYSLKKDSGQGIRPLERLVVRVKSVRFAVDDQDLRLGGSSLVADPLMEIDTTVANCTNDIKEVKVELDYNQTSSWLKTDDSFVNSDFKLEKKTTIRLPFGSDGNLFRMPVELDPKLLWRENSGDIWSVDNTVSVNIILPPKSKLTGAISLFKETAEIPYEADVFMKYTMSFFGFLHKDGPFRGNAFIGNPQDEPTILAKFGKYIYLTAPQDLKHQYLNRDVLGDSKWDWYKLPDIANTSEENIDKMVGALNRKHGVEIAGTFTAIDAGLSKYTDTGPLPFESGDEDQFCNSELESSSASRQSGVYLAETGRKNVDELGLLKNISTVKLVEVSR
ncbi:MAG: aerolysin family beta-barrel pore-forming toxin [Gammaproteobacteria bacterium]|nr:aerolysin family beta-barrel pore-forming toxin [Gammaproteobacteria bacterium]